MAKGKFTIDHEAIRRWAEERDGHPARVKAAGKKGPPGHAGGILRIDFGEPETSLETISWEEFFNAFEENNLAFLYQDEIEGKKSRFFKFVDRESVEDKLGEDAGEGDDDGDADDDDDDDDKDELTIAESEVEGGALDDDDEDDEEEEEE